MRIHLFVIYLIFLNLNVFAQELTAAIELPEFNTLYRGYPNKINPVLSNRGKGRMLIVGEGVSISKSEGDSFVIVKPQGNRRSVYISILLIHKKDTTLVRRIEYRISNLPDATIFWGGSKENDRANIREVRLFAKYGPEIPLNAQFSVISWKMNVDSNVIMSKGNNLKSAESILKKFDGKSNITIEVEYIGPDGVIKKKTVTWNVESWDDTKEPNLVQPGG